MRNMYNILVGIPEGKIPLERPGRIWESNIKIELKEIDQCCDGVDWVHVARDTV
jgi:hypothetical protein